jgi:hypothetical protein
MLQLCRQVHTRLSVSAAAALPRSPMVLLQLKEKFNEGYEEGRSQQA